MQRSGTYWSFFMMGVFAEALLLLEAFWLMNIEMNALFVLNLLLAGILYVGYRYVMDWNYFSNDLSKEAREYVIRKSGTNQLIFSGACGFLLLLSNLNLVSSIPIMLIWAFGFVAALISFNVVDLLRETANWMHSHKTEVEDWEKQRQKQAI